MAKRARARQRPLDLRKAVVCFLSMLAPTLATASCSSSRDVGERGHAATSEPVSSSVTIASDVRSYRSPRDYQTPAEPVTVEIPALGMVSELQHLQTAEDGTIEVPDWHRAGWWAEGPKPGQQGPAIILGHVDSAHGPDVFYRLHTLQPGDEIVVTRVDGSVVRFTIERLEQHPKADFPTDAVYASSLEPALRLITCGGSFDRSVGHYRDNIIAFAVLMEA